jgi:lipoprotein-releasing system ATP-binding protein
MPISIRKGHAEPEDVERVTALLERVGLGHRLDNPPGRLSGGEQQRTAIVRALANRPRLVLADEPTGNLDSRSSAQVFELMREINEETGVAFVMVTHDDRLAARGDRIVRIEDGLLTED